MSSPVSNVFFQREIGLPRETAPLWGLGLTTAVGLLVNRLFHAQFHGVHRRCCGAKLLVSAREALQNELKDEVQAVLREVSLVLDALGLQSDYTCTQMTESLCKLIVSHQRGERESAVRAAATDLLSQTIAHAQALRQRLQRANATLNDQAEHVARLVEASHCDIGEDCTINNNGNNNLLNTHIVEHIETLLSSAASAASLPASDLSWSDDDDILGDDSPYHHHFLTADDVCAESESESGSCVFTDMDIQTDDALKAFFSDGETQTDAFIDGSSKSREDAETAQYFAKKLAEIVEFPATLDDPKGISLAHLLDALLVRLQEKLEALQSSLVIADNLSESLSLEVNELTNEVARTSQELFSVRCAMQNECVLVARLLRRLGIPSQSDDKLLDLESVVSIENELEAQRNQTKSAVDRLSQQAEYVRRIAAICDFELLERRSSVTEIEDGKESHADSLIFELPLLDDALLAYLQDKLSFAQQVVTQQQRLTFSLSKALDLSQNEEKEFKCDWQAEEMIELVANELRAAKNRSLEVEKDLFRYRDLYDELLRENAALRCDLTAKDALLQKKDRAIQQGETRWVQQRALLVDLQSTVTSLQECSSAYSLLEQQNKELVDRNKQLSVDVEAKEMLLQVALDSNKNLEVRASEDQERMSALAQENDRLRAELARSQLLYQETQRNHVQFVKDLCDVTGFDLPTVSQKTVEDDKESAHRLNEELLQHVQSLVIPQALSESSSQCELIRTDSTDLADAYNSNDNFINADASVDLLKSYKAWLAPQQQKQQKQHLSECTDFIPTEEVSPLMRFVSDTNVDAQIRHFSVCGYTVNPPCIQKASFVKKTTDTQSDSEDLFLSFEPEKEETHRSRSFEKSSAVAVLFPDDNDEDALESEVDGNAHATKTTVFNPPPFPTQESVHVRSDRRSRSSSLSDMSKSDVSRTSQTSYSSTTSSIMSGLRRVSTHIHSYYPSYPHEHVPSPVYRPPVRRGSKSNSVSSISSGSPRSADHSRHSHTERPSSVKIKRRLSPTSITDLMRSPTSAARFSSEDYCKNFSSTSPPASVEEKEHELLRFMAYPMGIPIV